MAVLSKPLPYRPTKRRSTARNYSDDLSNSASAAGKPVLKALLIATAGNNKNPKGPRTLLTPHRDARAWRDTLITLYGYKEPDITMMLDDDETLGDPERAHLVPSKDNIITQMRELEAGARPGDRFMFYYNGHGVQIESQNKDEEDGRDEAIVPYTLDGKVDHILDDDLRKLLVEPLPAGAALTAIFDCCQSGTMLDLEHYACNNVPFPWVNRGLRDLDGPLRAHLQRATALHGSLLQRLEDDPTGGTTQPDATGAGLDPGSENRVILQVVRVRARTLEPPPRCSARWVPRRTLTNPVRGNIPWVQHQCEEPESFLRCDGFSCRVDEEEERTKPDVISISACQDGEQTWESRTGPTFTQALISLLEDDPHPPVRQLVQHAGLVIYRESTQKLHSHCRTQLKKLWARPRPKKEMRTHLQYEIFNSPRPQIGSTYFLRADERFRA